MTTRPLFSVRRLQVTYGRIAAVREVDLDVFPGEFVSIIGANGAGKSSTLKAIMGIEASSSEAMSFEGRSVAGLRIHQVLQRGIALVPEGRWIFKNQTVAENLELGAYSRLPGDARRVERDIEVALKTFPRLRERYRQQAGLLSGGEQQMLAIARALLSQPKMLLIDELSLGLAPKVLDELFQVLSDLNQKGLAILLVEQIASRALAVTNRTYVFEQGRVSLSGESRVLANDPRVIESYLGNGEGTL